MLGLGLGLLGYWGKVRFSVRVRAGVTVRFTLRVSKIRIRVRNRICIRVHLRIHCKFVDGFGFLLGFRVRVTV